MQANHVESDERIGSDPRAGWLGHAIVSGFAATIIMLFVFLAAYGLASLASTVALANKPGAEIMRLWLHNLTNNALIDAARTNLYSATALYLAGGLAWAVIYACLAEPRLPGPGWLRGGLFSIVPAILSVVVFLPLVGAGVLGSELGAGPLPVVGNLLLHVVYGTTLGHLYGPFGDVDATTLERTTPGVEVGGGPASQRLAASGLLVGLLLGAGLGIAGAVVANLGPDQTLLGEPAAALVLSTAVLGATLGGLIGSFLDLSARAT